MELKSKLSIVNLLICLVSTASSLKVFSVLFLQSEFSWIVIPWKNKKCNLSLRKLENRWYSYFLMYFRKLLSKLWNVTYNCLQSHKLEMMIMVLSTLHDSLVYVEVGHLQSWNLTYNPSISISIHGPLALDGAVNRKIS